MKAALFIAAFVALAYQAVALLAVLVQRERMRLAYRKAGNGYTPPVSILKPVRGLDDGFLEAIRSHVTQDYPKYEVLFGVHSLDDPSVPAIRQLMEEFPEAAIRLIVSDRQAANGKVGVLLGLEGEARYDILLMNDSDVTVPRDYLRRVVAPLQSINAGLVTCLYRATATSLPGQWEALGIATDFIPSTLVAPLVGIREFGLGSTLCFRKEDLRAIGGFAVLADYIADDYQLAKRITKTGKHAHLSEVVVETTFSDPDWGAVWRHQVRWARTIRVSRGDGFLGLPVTQAGFWAILCAATGMWEAALTLWVARMTMGLAGSLLILRHWPALPMAPLIPLWDVWAFAVWIAGWTGDTIEWRGNTLKLGRDGKMTPISR